MKLEITRAHLSKIECGKYCISPEVSAKLETLVDNFVPHSRPVLARLMDNHGICARDLARETRLSEVTVRDILAGEPNRVGAKKVIEAWAASRGLPVKNLWIEQEEPPMEGLDLTETARSRFKLFADPFDSDLDPETFFGGRKSEWPEINDIEKRLEAAYLKQKNVAIRGQVGSGKSTLNRRLLGRFEKDGEPVFVIEPEIVDKKLLRPSLILERIIRDCNVADSRVSLGASLEERSSRAKKALTTVADRGLRATLLIEEAHELPDDTIKQFKTMSEWFRGVDKLISIVMIGQPELDQKIKRWTNRQWFSRCVTIHMPGLGNRIGAYIKFRCEAKGVNPDKLFAADGLKAITSRMATQTYDTPLLVGNFTKACVNKAAALGTKVDERVVLETRPMLRPDKAELKSIRKKARA